MGGREEQRMELRELEAVRRQLDAAYIHHLVAEPDQLFAVLGGIWRRTLQPRPGRLGGGFEICGSSHLVVAEDRVDPEAVDLLG